MKHKLKNIANRQIPVDGTDLRPASGEIVEAEITERLKQMIKNKFFEDLGVVEEEAEVGSEVFMSEEPEEEAKPIEDYMPKKQKTPHKKKGKKKSNKNG